MARCGCCLPATRARRPRATSYGVVNYRRAWSSALMGELRSSPLLSDVLTVQEGSYRICGTAARIIDALSPDERELIAIAGNRELPDAQSDQTPPDWEGLKTTVATVFPGKQ